MTENITETPEFKAALAKSIKEASDGILERLQAVMGASEGSGPAVTNQNDASALFRQMALAIAEISDQGTNRKRVAPEVLAAREDAKNRMGELIMKAQSLKGNNRPRYRLVAKVYLREVLIEPYQRVGNRNVPTEIFWSYAPNTAMRPVNEVAKEIYEQFVQWIGGAAEVNSMRGAPAPVWVTGGGAVIAGTPPSTASVHGNVYSPDPLTVEDYDEDVAAGGNGASNEDNGFGFSVPQNPEAPQINVLGTVAPPARRMSPTDRQ